MKLPLISYFSSSKGIKNKRKSKMKDIQHSIFEGKIIKISRAALSNSIFYKDAKILKLHCPIW